MGEQTRTIDTVITVSCDVHNCGAAESHDVVPVGYMVREADVERYPRETWQRERDARRVFYRHLDGLGWTLWHGRSSRYYCPDHTPTRGHNMRRIDLAERAR